MHAEKKYAVAIQTTCGCSQDDWLDICAAVLDDHGTPESHIDQVRMWAFGDVWTVIPDRGAGVSGICADNAGAALAHFRENFEKDEDSVPQGSIRQQPVNQVARELGDRR
ncbi:hypothetical protein ABZ379_06635 [Streptomyces canus]|uniref:hypothetical protein n=1 Tax=Streptomyces canus TaxID=58343 RepID=UPI0034035612